ncbi:MAG TPA: YfiR family protein [Verrucomicrobiae bacterium]|nr:YfiR family protein [Verrucomicrobiae bacterium]
MSTALLLVIPSGRAQAPAPSEKQVKVAFLYNFAKFIDWPSEAFTNESSPFTIGILGDNPFGTLLEQMVAGRKINERPIRVQTFQADDPAITNCHILFVSVSEKKHLGDIFQKLHGSSVLSVSDAEGFLAAGGMVSFVVVDGKIRFQINDRPAKAARLKISAKLLSLAVPISG